MNMCTLEPQDLRNLRARVQKFEPAHGWGSDKRDVDALTTGELMSLVEWLRSRNADLSVRKTEFAPPAFETVDGVMVDKSQDADWLRARYFEGTKRIEELETGACRYNCRTKKDNWIAGYLHAARVDDDYADMGSKAMLAMAEGDYDDWKRKQET